jgi:Arc/MetJ-type ribon-helix-helix transcriptional regulator
MSNTRLHISVPERLKEAVEEHVKRTGTYSNASGYGRSLIRADLEPVNEERLEERLLKGLASGEPEPLDFPTIRRKGHERVQPSGEFGGHIGNSGDTLRN